MPRERESHVGEDFEDLEDPVTARRRLAAVWLCAGSAVAAMVATSWYDVLRRGKAPGGDMLGHAAAAEWFRTLPWWDWRGWSDWFYGGQAMGVNYPPLSHLWLRFTDPYHGQMAAVALGLLVLLPWGALRLARAAGCKPPAQRAAVAAVLVLTAASGHMHWLLSGFHSEQTFFGSWPAMLAAVTGLHCAAWAAQCRKPALCGAVLGIAVLLNASVVPGIVVVCAAMLVTSGASLRQGTRWSATVGAISLVVCAWWLVPFMAGWSRLIRWDVPLSDAWKTTGMWGAGVLAILGVGAAWAARLGDSGPRRLAMAALAGLAATVLAEWFGYLRPERWLQTPILVAALAVGGLIAAAVKYKALRPPRPAWTLVGAAFVIVLLVITTRLELVPLAVWLLAASPRRAWAWGGALAWSAVLLWVPILGTIIDGPADARPSVQLMEAVALQAEPGAEGSVFAAQLYRGASGALTSCSMEDPWHITAETNGHIRPILGLYGATSASTEFLDAEANLRLGSFREDGGRRPHWWNAWEDAGQPSLGTQDAAEAMGARWYAVCNDEGGADVVELRARSAVGTAIVAFPDERSWHDAATRWWMAAATGTLHTGAAEAIVPVLMPKGSGSRPAEQAATGVSLDAGQDRLTLHADTAGWVWIRVTWDPYWQSETPETVFKGGPGHLVVWAERGTTELRWSVPGLIDTAAAAATGVGLIAALGLVLLNRRHGFVIDPHRHKPFSDALAVFADTLDRWWAGACTRLRRLAVWRRKHRRDGRQSP